MSRQFLQSFKVYGLITLSTKCWGYLPKRRLFGFINDFVDPKLKTEKVVTAGILAVYW